MLSMVGKKLPKNSTEAKDNTTRKATVAYPTVKRLVFHMFYATHLQKLLKSHEMV